MNRPDAILPNICYNTVMLSKDLRTWITHGYYVDPVCVAALSPYATKDLERFGKYTLNLAQVPDPVDYNTPVVSQVPLEDSIDLASKHPQNSGRERYKGAAGTSVRIMYSGPFVANPYHTSCWAGVRWRVR
jgi:hypothetical protein